jgi:hypothetical protein
MGDGAARRIKRALIEMLQLKHSKPRESFAAHHAV